MGGSILNGTMLVGVAPVVMNAGLVSFDALPYLVFGVPAVITAVLGRLLGVIGLWRWLQAYVVIFGAGVILVVSHCSW